MAKKELTKKEKIKKEITRLNKIYKDIDDKKKKVVDGLIQRSAFMKITLEELEEDIIENGTVEEMPQGEYSITVQRQQFKGFIAMVQRYTTIEEKLLSLLPKDIEKVEDDGFEAFVNEK